MILVVILAPETMALWVCGCRLHYSKTLRGTDLGVQNSAGHRLRWPKLCREICLQYLPCKFFDPPICARGVYEPSFCAPRSWEQCNLRPGTHVAIVSGAQITTKKSNKILSFFKVILLSHCHFKDLYKYWNVMNKNHLNWTELNWTDHFTANS